MKRKVYLHEGWHFGWCPQGQASKPSQVDGLVSIPARVPGCTVEDLLAAKVIRDPFVDAQFRDALWCEGQDFWYRTVFDWNESARAEGESLLLALDGIDTFASIWLNDNQIGETHNMFRRYRFPIDRVLRDGSNTLTVRLHSPIAAADRLAKAWGIDASGLSAAFRTTERLVARKMQMSYGWDNHPRLVMSGIFRPVWIERRSGAVISDAVPQTTSVSDTHSHAEVVVDVDIDRAPDGAEVRLIATCGASHVEGASSFAPSETDAARVRVFLQIENPALWWPNGQGSQNLYEGSVELVHKGEVLAEEGITFGVRTIEVRTGPAERRRVDYRVGVPDGSIPALDGGDEGAWSHLATDSPEEVDVHPYVFVVNGRPIPIVGANWQPPDAVYSRVDGEGVRSLVCEAREAGFNMIRVWGGGYVELPEFYEACTRFGLLVWQDFPFASGIYPQADGFVREVEAEARDIVAQLRGHTCLAVWCGDNESDMTSRDHGRDPATNPINHGVLPAVVSELDPLRHYHPSSPFGVDYPRSPWSGDNRNWGAWNPEGNFLHIRREEARFISEGGAYALPSVAVVETSLSPPHRTDFEGWVWNLHGGSTDTFWRDFPQKSVRMWEHFTPIQSDASIEHAVEVSQFAQAWGAMILVLHCRRRWPETGGVLWWKLNDCWPCMDGGIIDYARARRLVFYAMKYATSPQVLAFHQPPTGQSPELHLINHTSQSLSVRVSVSTIGPDGAIRPKPTTHDVTAEPWTTLRVARSANQEEGSPSQNRFAWAEGAPHVASGLWTSSPNEAWRIWRASPVITSMWRGVEQTQSETRIVDSRTCR